jgi:hypothetical protein
MPRAPSLVEPPPPAKKGGRKPALSPQEAVEVRTLYADRGAKWTAAALARSFRVRTATIQAALNRTGAYRLRGQES